MDEIITEKDCKKEIIYRKKTGIYKKHELVSPTFVDVLLQLTCMEKLTH